MWIGENKQELIINDNCYICKNRDTCPDLKTMKKLIYKKWIPIMSCAGYIKEDLKSDNA